MGEDLTLGQYLKAIRESRNLTLRDVERIVEGKLSNAAISQIETGHTKEPSVKVLHMLSAAYAIDFAELCKRAAVGQRERFEYATCPMCGRLWLGGRAETEVRRCKGEPVAWLDIATAPKDRPVLLYGHLEPHPDRRGLYGHLERPTMTAGYWCELDEAWAPAGSTWEGPWFKPTHWMPLPGAPLHGPEPRT